MEIKKQYATKNDCYKKGERMTPKGIVVHSTGANNPTLKRYVQPDDGLIGVNPYHNSFNEPNIKPAKCVHAFIGKDKNGKVRCYQTLPWNYKCWGCGTGSKGSYNSNYIQFEICEDALTDAKYFNEAFSLAIELCKYLCKTYDIPTSNIVSHHEAHLKGYASGHADCDHWLKKHGKTMDWFRKQVSATATSTKKVTTKTAKVKTSGKGLNMRNHANTESNIICSIPNGSKVTYTTKGTTWTKVSYGGKTGYCINKYLIF